MVLSTCNRTEVYASSGDIDALKAAVVGALTGHFNVDRKWLEEYTYTMCDGQRHTSTFSSWPPASIQWSWGSRQYSDRSRTPIQSACTFGASGPFFRKVFHRAFQVAKRVRTETRIGYDPVSISGMAVELARKIFGDLGHRQILVIGAGEMCEIALKHFKKGGLQEIFVTNRTLAKAQRLAEEIIGSAYPFEEISELLLKAAMVLSSTGADEPIIDKAMVAHAMKLPEEPPPLLHRYCHTQGHRAIGERHRERLPL